MSAGSISQLSAAIQPVGKISPRKSAGSSISAGEMRIAKRTCRGITECFGRIVRVTVCPLAD
jgi:hypothetical protein